MKYFHLKIAIGIIVVFGLLLLGFAMWTPVRVKYYAWQYRSPDVAARVKAIDGFIKLGEPGTKKLKAICPDGPEAAKMLIECWDDVNQRIEDPNKAFSLLKLEKSWELYQDSDYTPISYQHIAAFNGYLETVKLLMQKGGYNDCHGWCCIRKPKGKKKEKAGYTRMYIFGAPIHVAIALGRNQVINFILSQGIDVNAMDDFGRTPLRLAARYGDTKTAKLLISKGADVNAKDYPGRTALDLAIILNHKKTEKLLRSHGAKTGEELRAEKK